MTAADPTATTRPRLKARCIASSALAAAAGEAEVWMAAHPVTARMMMLEETAQMLPVPICFLVRLSEVSSRM